MTSLLDSLSITSMAMAGGAFLSNGIYNLRNHFNGVKESKEMIYSRVIELAPELTERVEKIISQKQEMGLDSLGWGVAYIAMGCASLYAANWSVRSTS